MACPLCALRGHADDRARRDDRERRPAIDPGGPGLLADQPRMGRGRILDRFRRSVVAGGPHRRPDRSAPHLSLRPRHVHGRLAALRHGPEPGTVDRRALRAGRWRGADVRGHPRDDRDHVPGAPGAGEGDRRLHLRSRGRRLDRAPGGRGPHRDDQLALDLLRQHSDRHRDRAVGDQARARPRGDRTRGRR